MVGKSASTQRGECANPSGGLRVVNGTTRPVRARARALCATVGARVYRCMCLPARTLLTALPLC